MEIISFTKNSLNDFITSNQFNELINIPISRHRALSQINNPRISDSDIILVAQFHEDKVIGYLGVLPDYIFLNEEKEKAGWLTCFWVDDQYKSFNVAANLFRRVIRAWDQKIIITNIVPRLEPVYQKTKIFQPTRYKIGFRGYMRFNFSEILPPKKKIFRQTVPLLKLTDFILNILCDQRFLFLKQHRNENIKFEYLTCFTKQASEFIDNHNSKYWNRRAKTEIDWILQNPWIIQGAIADENSSKYYFSSLSKRFFYQIIKFTNNKQEIIGIIIINIRDNDLKIPYAFSDLSCRDAISKFLISTMINLKLNMVTVFNDELIPSLKKTGASFLFTKKIKKPYFISKKIDYVNELNFQDGDGDCAFY